MVKRKATPAIAVDRGECPGTGTAVANNGPFTFRCVSGKRAISKTLRKVHNVALFKARNTCGIFSFFS